MTGRLPPPGPHGGDGPRVAAALGLDPATVVDLSQTRNPVAPDPAAAVARHLAAVGEYPDATEATAAVADRLGLPTDQVLLTNGGAEAIALVAQDLGRGRVEAPEFSLWARHLVLDPTGPRVRSNPNSPRGTLADATDRAAVWDEAFWPLTTGTWTRGDVDRGSVVVGSLTKLLACPGLRLGYVAADPATVARLAGRQPRWSVSSLATRSLPDLLAPVDLPRWAAEVAELRGALVAACEAAGLTCDPGVAPWVVVAGHDLRARLAPRGVVVRDLSSFGLPGRWRLAVPRAEDLARVADALVAAVHDGPVATGGSPETPDDEQEAR